MAEEAGRLKHPWMVAVWPGMGNVSINAGYYLMSKLGMHLESELEARELFEINHVEVEKGIIRIGQLPRSRFFLWRDPKGERDLIIFLGEAQPPTGVYAYCSRIIRHARSLGVERVFTFAAMATQMQLEDDSRVFGAATGVNDLAECEALGLENLHEAQISGLNGVLLGVAAESGVGGTCLLGEMPNLFSQIPFPRASLAVLRAFSKMSGIPIDFTDLEDESQAMEGRLKVLMKRIGEAMGGPQDGEEESFGPALEPEAEDEAASGPTPQERHEVEELFARAVEDRSQAYHLKQELDRLKLFAEYEDRFLDLFKEPGPGPSGNSSEG